MSTGLDTNGQYVRFLPDEPVPFRFFRQFRDFDFAEIGKAGKSRLFLGRILDEYFASDSLADKFVRAMAARRAMYLKEVLESFEFFARVRKRLRGPVVADLCCGHGLVGILYAMYERSVDRVILIDSRRPESFDRIMAAAEEVAPWIAAKLEYVTRPMEEGWQGAFPAATPMVAIHACGRLTDACLQLAADTRSPIAAMPCCYFPGLSKAPSALNEALGYRLAADIERTYRMERAGFEVRWYRIPEEITPMNRILLCRPAPAG